MTPYAAQRIRFGILAARHMLERERLTTWQVDDLEGCKASGWKNRDSLKAFDRENRNIYYRGLASTLERLATKAKEDRNA